MPYARLDELDKLPDYTHKILLGTRSPGKSYCVKERAIQRALGGRKFFWLKRYELECKNYMVQKYFDDMDDVIKNESGGDYDKIVCYNRDLFFGKTQSDGTIKRASQCIGSSAYLAGESHFKSMVYKGYDTMIFEEFVTDAGYLPDESTKLNSIISTVFRTSSAEIYLIGNTITRSCPYFYDWGLKNVIRQKPGTIDLYHHVYYDSKGERHQINIAVEHFLPPDKTADLYIGEPTIAAGGWTTHEHQGLSCDYKDCEIFYTFYIKHGYLGYVAQILRDKNNDTLLYVYPKNPDEFSRDHMVLADEYHPSMQWVNHLDPSIPLQRAIKKLIDYNKVVFSDNLTGEEFYQLKREGVIK